MNPLAGLKALRNVYMGLRHGQSEANVAAIVLSDPATGVPRYGLTPLGREQVRRSVPLAGLGADTQVLSSDFRRAHETATLAAELLGAAPPTLDSRLRERWFGDWEQTSNANYERVWEGDAEDPTHTQSGVESATATLARVGGLVAELEAAHEGRTLLLVSHGDALQLLQTAFLRACPSTHRQRDHWAPAEVRRLELG